MNLLKETLNMLELCNKNEEDVLWVGRDNFYMSFKTFKTLADVEYDTAKQISNVLFE